MALLPEDVTEWLCSSEVAVITTNKDAARWEGPMLGLTGRVEAAGLYTAAQCAGVIKSKEKGDGSNEWILTYAQNYHNQPSTQERMEQMIGHNLYNTWPKYRATGWRMVGKRMPGNSWVRFYAYYQGQAGHILVNRLLRHALIYGGLEYVDIQSPFHILYYKFVQGRPYKRKRGEDGLGMGDFPTTLRKPTPKPYADDKPSKKDKKDEDDSPDGKKPPAAGGAIPKAAASQTDKKTPDKRFPLPPALVVELDELLNSPILPHRKGPAQVRALPATSTPKQRAIPPPPPQRPPQSPPARRAPDRRRPPSPHPDRRGRGSRPTTPAAATVVPVSTPAVSIQQNLMILSETPATASQKACSGSEGSFAEQGHEVRPAATPPRRSPSPRRPSPLRPEQRRSSSTRQLPRARSPPTGSRPRPSAGRSAPPAADRRERRRSPSRSPPRRSTSQRGSRSPLRRTTSEQHRRQSRSPPRRRTSGGKSAAQRSLSPRFHGL